MNVKQNDNECIFSKDPFIATYNNIITDEECKHFIHISKDLLQRALVSSNKKGYISQGRTGSNTWISHDHDEITKKVGERIAKIVQMPLENAESFQIIHYGVTQEYRQHYDSWEHNGSEKTLRCMKWGGARIKTALCYLNDVKKGGGTKMTKLNITIPAEKGKLLVFQNTIGNNNHDRHPLSEHAGLPVEEGEKYAFNLWFKECSPKMLYSAFNPEYYLQDEKPTKTIEKTTEKKTPEGSKKKSTSIKNKNRMLHNYNSLHDSKKMFTIKSFFDTSLFNIMLKYCTFNTRERRGGWIKISLLPNLIKKIEQTTGIDSSFYENINVIEYKENILHKKHFDAYDLNSDIGKKYTHTLGQRIYTLSLFLSDNIEVNFPSIKSVHTFQSGDLLWYKNIDNDSLNRDKDLERTIVCKKGTGYLANIYIRYNNNKGETCIEYDENKQTKPAELKTVELKISEVENYIDTLDHVFKRFQHNEVTKNWRGLNSFKYNFKGNFTVFKEYITRFNNIRISLGGSCLNKANLEIDYKLDDILPLQIVNNVLDNDVLKLLQIYYKETIDKNVWKLGDRQSNRYKAHNEPMSRFLHYECLPLIEKIVGRSLRPTYTYLSAYVKGADLPPHTDRPDCEYTVSFVVDKPEGSNWNIYVHKPQQEVKYKGRYDEKPPLEECESVDCDAGGLMLFQGTDHIHFREELEGDYYNIVLLHYCSV